MKYNTILVIAAAGLMTNGTLATETTQRGEILEGINMFTPEDGDPAYKVKANEEFGTQ